jgi:formylglycine-generating enzyme required for sulfatase activity
MGTPEGVEYRDSSEGPVHSVTLDPFLIAKTEVSQAQYKAVMGPNPSKFPGDERPGPWSITNKLERYPTTGTSPLTKRPNFMRNQLDGFRKMRMFHCHDIAVGIG